MSTGTSGSVRQAQSQPPVRPVSERARGPGKVPILLKINGASYHLEVEPRRTLLDALRLDLHLTGSKKACDMGECGACTVILDGKAVYSCLLLAIECEGREIITVEGLSSNGSPDSIQQAFIDHNGFQCGFCTSGQVMSVHALLKANPSPSQEDIKQALAGNICRCGAYPRIFAAAEAAANIHPQKRPGNRRRTAHDQPDQD